jgi:Uma2 family endonuclease
MPLLLAVEVLSPSTARVDRQTKRRIYQNVRVPEYWIVDLNARLVVRWTRGDERPEVITGILEWQPRTEVQPLRVVLEEILGPVED